MFKKTLMQCNKTMSQQDLLVFAVHTLADQVVHAAKLTCCAYPKTDAFFLPFQIFFAQNGNRFFQNNLPLEVSEMFTGN